MTKIPNIKHLFETLGFRISNLFRISDLEFQIYRGDGFTLLETVVALTVILAAVVGPVSLITRSIFASSFSRNKVIAMNLAQEGIELVRAVRENNVLCDSLNGTLISRNWNSDPTNISGTAKLNGKYAFDATDTVDMDCRPPGAPQPLLISTPRPSGACQAVPLRIDSNGFYGYAGLEQTTIFYRCIDICTPPKLDSTCASSADTDVPAEYQAQYRIDQMDVISIVTWREHSVEKTASLRERLYNWR